MESSSLGKIYRDNEMIIRQGEQGDCMYVIQEGVVEIVKETDRGNFQIALRRTGEFFGEMAIFEREVRSATVRALGQARVLTIDKRNFLRRINEDPALAFHLVQVMSARIRELSKEVARLKIELEGDSENIMNKDFNG